MRLRSDGVTWREIDGEMVILDLVSSTYLTTNRTGAHLMRLLVEERTHADLVAALVGEYGISDERADADVTAFADLLREHDLLRTSTASSDLAGTSSSHAMPHWRRQSSAS